MIKKHILRTRLTRRQMMKLGLIAGGAAMLPLGSAILRTRSVRAHGNEEGSPAVEPFQVELPIPAVLNSVGSTFDTSFDRPPGPTCSVDVPDFPSPLLLPPNYTRYACRRASAKSSPEP